MANVEKDQFFISMRLEWRMNIEWKWTSKQQKCIGFQRNIY